MNFYNIRLSCQARHGLDCVFERIESCESQIALARGAESAARSADYVIAVEQEIEELPGGQSVGYFYPHIGRVYAAHTFISGFAETLAHHCRIVKIIVDGLFDLTLDVTGDLAVDGHHTVEDTGIVIGQAIREAVGDKAGIRRYGSFILPMDDALCLCAIDLSGRPYFVFDCAFPTQSVGGLDTQLVREFFYAVSYSAGVNLHIKMFHGENTHHMIEAMFKAFAKALDTAVTYDERITGVLSTKGTL